MINESLTIRSHFKRVAKLPCEMFGNFSLTVRFLTTRHHEHDAAGGRNVFVMLHSYFKISLLSFDSGRTDRNADCCVNTVVEKQLGYYGYKFGEPGSSKP